MQKMLMLYWDIGHIVAKRQTKEGWGANIIPRLATDIRNDLPEMKGFSERNLGRMLSFYREYSALVILPLAVAKISQEEARLHLQTYVFQIPWTHNIILMREKDLVGRLWYLMQALEHGWSRDRLEEQIKQGAYLRQGKATNAINTTVLFL